MPPAPASHAAFIHLRVHSAYSLAEGALGIEQLVALCGRDAMPAVAVTDTMNLFGALEFAMAAVAAGVQPIIGCQLAIRPDDAAVASNGNSPTIAVPDHLVVLVQSEPGYQNLLRLVSDAYRDGDPAEPAQLSLDALADTTDGLLALTGGPAGAVGRLLANGQGPAAAAMLERLEALFAERLYVELQRHSLAAEDRIEAALIDLAVSHGLPLVATNECFFADDATYEAHDALLCIADSAYVSERERRRVTPEHRFKSAEEMRALFADIPEAIDNTLTIARRCAFMPVPAEPILPAFPTPAGRTEAVEMRAQASAGLDARLARHVFTDAMDTAAREAAAEPYRSQLNYEIDVIEKMGFSGYFLIVAEFIKWARANAIPVGPGRGSGAASVVAWSLTITDLDPLRWGLLFERFLNPERVSMPDFDIDFAQEGRDRVIHHVQDTYGHDRVAQIITFGKLQARAVLKDVGRVLEMPYSRVDRISKLVPYNPANPVSLAQAIAGEPQLQQLRAEDEAVAHLIDIALKLEGLYRNSSTHAAGVVIGDRPLDALIPLYRDPRSDMLVTQFSMKYVERSGLVKFDFLGLKTLDVLARAIELLARRDVSVDLETLPLDDAKTFELLARGDTTGIFQCESAGVRDVLRRLKTDRFEDIIAVVALYRPGPMDNIDSYVARKHDEEAVDYYHPSLEPVLAETHGIPIYQEQVMQMAQVLSGYTLGGADLLRRAMGKKIQSEMDAQRDTFIAGAVDNGVAGGLASHVFDVIAKFAGYGFNKAHAAAYALIAYQTAYLKANYPVEFLAACMTFDMGNTDKLAIYRQELATMGIALRPPDVNAGEPDFSVAAAPDGDGGAIHYALAAIKGVGRAAAAAIADERAANGPYTGLFDLAARVDAHHVTRRQLESLAAAGAFDGLNANRAQVSHAVELMVAHAHAAQADRDSGQIGLFGDALDGGGAPPALPEVENWARAERLQREFEAIGFYLSAHPLDDYEKALARLKVTQAASLAAKVAEEGGTASVKLAGTVLDFRQRTSQRGNRYAFVQLSDPSGTFEVVLFAETLTAARDLLDGEKPLLIQAMARSEEEDRFRLIAQHVEELDIAAQGTQAGMKIWLDDSARLAPLKGLLDREARGNGQRARGHITLAIHADAAEVEIGLDGGYACTPEVRAAVRAIAGVVEVQET